MTGDVTLNRIRERADRDRAERKELIAALRELLALHTETKPRGAVRFVGEREFNAVRMARAALSRIDARAREEGET